MWRPSPWSLIVVIAAIGLAAAFAGAWWTTVAMILVLPALVGRLRAGDRGAPISKDPADYR